MLIPKNTVKPEKHFSKVSLIGIIRGSLEKEAFNTRAIRESPLHTNREEKMLRPKNTVKSEKHFSKVSLIGMIRGSLEKEAFNTRAIRESPLHTNREEKC